MAIQWTEVGSSNIAAIGSVANDPDLYVQFNNSSIYVYHDVPEDVVQAFYDADSKGKFLNEHIKGVYDYEKIA